MMVVMMMMIMTISASSHSVDHDGVNDTFGNNVLTVLIYAT